MAGSVAGHDVVGTRAKDSVVRPVGITSRNDGWHIPAIALAGYADSHIPGRRLTTPHAKLLPRGSIRTGPRVNHQETRTMITKFNTVYAGHVDIPDRDRGQDGTPANDRRFSNGHLASVFSKTETIATLMDETG